MSVIVMVDVVVIVLVVVDVAVIVLVVVIMVIIIVDVVMIVTDKLDRTIIMNKQSVGQILANLWLSAFFVDVCDPEEFYHKLRPFLSG